MALQFKTRANASPQGKPRVYFCCHPLDFKAFFESISDEVLAKQNCAVWYVGEDGRDENFLSDLERMNLFVMPVTTRLLTTENPAMEEFRFAMEHHIPVLPLMQESGLEELFNKKCGDLQFLDQNARDDTAISYDEKLTNYLNSVLIGDELAEQIRAAFDAYIFLSYRKKDRRYAKELMKLIHKNDFCRDIAIWYDEFLTPGENFNDSIREALEKSGLFVLTVTPNVVNEENYIMTTEYPMAQEMAKPVLPVKMQRINPFALAKRYRGIPKCVDAHSGKKLSGALLDAVRSLAVRENDKDSQHNFFIGLAYLTGIDVEVDHDRAVALITSAAEAGLIEAVTKLKELYETGVGVERNYETAIYWQERKITLLEKAYKEDPSEDNCHDLCWANTYCGDQYKALGKLAPAKVRYEAAKEIAETCLTAADSFRKRGDLSASLNRLGDISKALGDVPGGKEYYEKSLAIFEQLAEETGTVDTQRNLSVCYLKLGDIREALKDVSGAKEYYEKSLAIDEQLAGETGTVEARRDLSVSYNKLGDISEALGDVSGAKGYYEKLLAISEQLAEETGTVQARRDLSISYNKMGDIMETFGDVPGAKGYYEKSLAIDEQLAEEPGTVEARRDLSISYERMGNISKALGDVSGAKGYYEKSLAIRQQLAAETGTVEARRDLSVSYDKLGDISKALGDVSGAKGYYEKSLAIDEQLAEETGTVEARRDLSVSYNNMGDIHKALGDVSGAKGYYEKSLAIAEQLAEETGAVEAWDDLAVSYFKCAMVSEENKAPYLQKAAQIYEMLCEHCPQVKLYRERLDIVKSWLQ